MSSPTDYTGRIHLYEYYDPQKDGFPLLDPGRGMITKRSPSFHVVMNEQQPNPPAPASTVSNSSLSSYSYSSSSADSLSSIGDPQHYDLTNAQPW
jgi:hypothetical protein